LRVSLFILFGFIFVSTVAAQDCIHCGRPSQANLNPREWPIEYITVKKIDYERNHKASFCKRPIDMVDTIVLHHSETPSTDTPERINEFHLDRGTAADPWYMIAYSYVINSAYPGSKTPATKVTEGRPLDIVGAHAGSDVFVPMDAQQKKMFDDGKITCGTENSSFKPDPTLVKNGKIKANVTTIGLVVIGNYSPFSSSNPNGYRSKNPRFPTKATQDAIARMSCQLQKKHPRMKTIKWHNFYHPTSCPGTIKNYLGQIKLLARNYGCEFN
jgi:hypothetical protein